MPRSYREVAAARARNRRTLPARQAALKIRKEGAGAEGPLSWAVDKPLIEAELGRSMSPEEETAARSAYRRGLL